MTFDEALALVYAMAESNQLTDEDVGSDADALAEQQRQTDALDIIAIWLEAAPKKEAGL